MNALKVVHVSETEARLEWVANTSNDMIADSALALLLGIDSSPATVKRKPRPCALLISVTSTPHSHSHSHTHSHPDSTAVVPHESNNHFYPGNNPEFDTLHLFLSAHFGQVSKPLVEVVDGEEDELLVMDVQVDDKIARVDLISMVRET